MAARRGADPVRGPRPSALRMTSPPTRGALWRRLGNAHQCHPTAALGLSRAHEAALGTVFRCPTCRRLWVVTHNHLRVGPRSICGCGWKLFEVEPEKLTEIAAVSGMSALAVEASLCEIAVAFGAIAHPSPSVITEAIRDQEARTRDAARTR